MAVKYYKILGVQAVTVERFTLYFNYFCGYVRISDEMFADIPRDIMEERIKSLNVHGNITYRGNGRNLNPPIIESEGEEYIGFDCFHADDLDNPKSEDYVLAECANIVLQIGEGIRTKKRWEERDASHLRSMGRKI